jgi:hypothetical protein
MKYGKALGRFAIAIVVVLGGIILILNCSSSTSSPNINYEWSLSIADLSDMSIPVALQGTDVDIPVYVEMTPDNAVIDSFTVTIAHDYSALSFVQANPGVVLSGWDDFEYSDNKYYSSERNTMLGLTKITARRMAVSGSPNQKAQGGNSIGQSENGLVELFTLRFYISDNPDYACTNMPLEFFWLNCSDNIIYYKSGKSLAYSRSVFGFDVSNIEDPWQLMTPPDDIIDDYEHFFGPFDNCTFDNMGNVSEAKASIEFYNGLVDIPCAEPASSGIDKGYSNSQK